MEHHPVTTEYTLFSKAHWTYTKIDDILNQKQTKWIQKNRNHTESAVSEHNRIKLEINKKDQRNVSKHLETIIHRLNGQSQGKI